MLLNKKQGFDEEIREGKKGAERGGGKISDELEKECVVWKTRGLNRMKGGLVALVGFGDVRQSLLLLMLQIW